MALVELSLDLRSTSQHLVLVRMRFLPRQRRVVLRLPDWTPGSYLLRSYVRNLEGLQVCQECPGGQLQPVVAERIDPSGWQLNLAELHPVELRYALLATELSVRACHLDGDHGFLALAAVALQVEGERWTAHQLRLDLPTGWQAFVPLPFVAGQGWSAPNYDALIDAPVEAGPHHCHAFSVADVPHRWVSWEDGCAGGTWLLHRFPSLLEDVASVCQACCRLMGEAGPAAPDYLFVLHLLDQGYGGLEHDRCSILQFGRQALARPDGYRKLLQLVAHEYLHQWNVRRLRPAELSPIDYNKAVIIPTLWFAEGVTSYFDQFLPLSVGISTEAQLFEDLGAELSRYRLTPGRLSGQTLRQSGQEAWVKLYRRDADSDDSQISYYLKGAVVALALDLVLRRSGSSLVQVLRDLWQRLGRCGRGYSEATLLDAFTQRSVELGELLPGWLDSFDEPDLDGYLSDVGLRLEAVLSPAPFTGMGCRVEPHGLAVQRVQRHSPAQRAGLSVGDELLAIDTRRLRQPEDLAALLVAERPQSLTVSRRGCLRQLTLLSEAPTVDRWTLVPDPAASAETLARRSAWLGLIPC
ncbi:MULTISPECIES: M61 family metallopeptidase [Synechococcales]|uniref:M61 family metallopeptidase n=1 Tax=Synechococcus sp. CS-1324 TaxID=2847980 RepID=UPI00223B93B3|nr:PDZ domain-containing protein [Synechococcus sp. CS-1324]